MYHTNSPLLPQSTVMSALPVLCPLKSPSNASGTLSKPRYTVSSYTIFPASTSAGTSAKNSSRRLR